MNDLTDNKNNRCFLCGSQDLELLHDKERGGKSLNNYVCKNCGFVFVLPRPGSSKMTEVYKAGKFSMEARGMGRPNFKKRRHSEGQSVLRYQLLSRYLEEKESRFPAGSKILEVGCGVGSFLRFMSAKGWKAEGIEPDGEFSSYVREEFGIPISDNFFEEQSFNEPFEVITSFHVIEHVEDPNLFLEKAWENLVPGGVLMLECPSIDRIYGPNVDHFFWDVHINTFSRRTLLAFLKKHHFTDLETYWNGHFIGILGRKAEKEGESGQTIEGDDFQKVIKRVKQYRPEKYKALVSTLKAGAKSVREDPESAIYKLSGRMARKWVATKCYSLNQGSLPSSGWKFAHVAMFSHSNAGDTLLPVMLRDVFDLELGESKWTKFHVHQPVKNRQIKSFNGKDAVIIGGGGLFLKDTNPNNLSGWQWSCSKDMLRRIQVPIILFAVGYNRFRGQADFDPLFSEHLNLLAERSPFIGLRNRGSLDKIKDYLDEKHYKKLFFQPCMTTLAAPMYKENGIRHPDDPPFISLNVAFDRSRSRFGEKIGESLSKLAKGCRALTQLAPLYYFSHTPGDEHFLPFLDSFQVDYKLVKLYNCPPREVLDWYRQPLLSLGMRGHAQLIPFGCGRPILSLISHNKLRYFLEDIDCTDWGVEVSDENLETLLPEKVKYILENLPENEKRVLQRQDELWEITQNNLRFIKEFI